MKRYYSKRKTRRSVLAFQYKNPADSNTEPTGKNVIFLDMSVKMSVSYEKSKIAEEMIKGEFPDRKLYIMDTRCISGGLGLLVKNMVARAE